MASTFSFRPICGGSFNFKTDDGFRRGVNYPAFMGLISWIGQNPDIRIK